MATATKNVETIVKVTGISLNLTIEEAEFLRDLMGRVAGDAALSRRKYSSSIADALDEAGVRENLPDDKGFTGSVMCDNGVLV